jgi:hypothetical protein
MKNMKSHLEHFAKKYLKAIDDNNAAIFAGAGLSIPSGYVNWKELLKEIAEELGLEIDKEEDLIALAQYYVTEKGGRGAINQKLIDEFTKHATLNPNLELIAKLPIKYFWTTNYDKLIEKALDEANKSVDVKISPENLATSLPRRDAILYKMHGDISLPHKAVLTKDDYENYNSERQLFTTALQGDLVSKTFLFIGFSFDDPNLEYILSRIRVLIGENQRDHFCFFRQPQESDYLKRGKSKTDAEELCKYERLRLQYRIKDLKRYSIQALIIDEYNEITEVLELLNKKIKRKNVFLSGAAHEFGVWGETRTNEFVYELSKNLVEKKYRLITGFGIGIGSSVINGVLSHVFSTKYRHIDESIIMRPFPQIIHAGGDIKKMWTDYRIDIAEESGISIFLFGNKLSGSSVIDSNGMVEEFDLSVSKGSIIIPIGATGYVAEKLWKKVNAEMSKYGYNTKELENSLYIINDKSKSNKELISEIIKIVNLLQ